MKTGAFLFLVAGALAGCGPVVAESATTSASGGGGNVVANSPACREIARTNAKHWATVSDPMETSIRTAESHFVEALEIMSGKKEVPPSLPPGVSLPNGVEIPGVNVSAGPAVSSSKLVRDARAKGIKLSISRGSFGLGFMLRTGSGTALSAAKVKQLEKAGLPPDAVTSLKNIERMRTSGGGDPAVVGLVSHVNAVSRAYGEVHEAAQHAQMTTIGVGASAKTTYRACQMELGPEDLVQARRMAALLRRANIAAAGVTATLATYQAVVDGADPKALDTVSAAMLKSLAAPATPATDDEVKAMLEQPKTLDRERFERSLSAVWGESYPQRMKPFVDNMFQSLDQHAAANAQLDGRAPYASPAQAPMPMPMPTPQAAAAPPLTPQFPSAKGPGPATTGMPSTATAALDAAQGLASTLPQGTIRSSVEGMVALGKGDVKGVFGAALNLVPGGTIARDGLSLTMRALGIAP